MTARLEHVLQEALALAPDEQRKLRELLETRLAPVQGAANPAAEDQIEQQLLAEGVLDHVPPPITDHTPYERRKPIPVQGTPVSELLIAERR